MQNKINLNNEVAGQVRVQAEEVNVSEIGKVNGGFEITTSNPNLKVDGATIDLIKEQGNRGAKTFIVTLLNTSIMDIVVYLIILIFVKKERLSAIAKKLDGGKRVLVNGLLSLVGIAMSIVVGIVLALLLPKLGIASVIFGVAVLIIFALLKNIIVIIANPSLSGILHKYMLKISRCLQKPIIDFFRQLLYNIC